jgi:hypothetical protein
MRWKRNAAFTGDRKAFTDSLLLPPPAQPYYRIRGKAMRLFYSTSQRTGHMILPLILILSGTVLAMSRFDIIHVARYWNLWPVLLIAAGLEELYLWATSGDDR